MEEIKEEAIEKLKQEHQLQIQELKQTITEAGGSP